MLIHIDATRLAETIAVDELRLQPQERRHAAELFGLLSDPGLYTYIGGYPGWSIDDLTARCERLESRRSADQTEYWLNWVVRSGQGRLVGYVQATVAGDGAEVAWVIGAAFQGQSYATRSAGAVLRWLAGVGCRRFVAHIHPDNAPSRRVALALGFTSAGMDDEGEEIWETSDAPAPG